MSLKDVLEAQKSGELDLLPGSAFNQASPLTIEDNGVYVLFHGDDWYSAELNQDLLLEALKLNGINESDIAIEGNSVFRIKDKKKIFEGESFPDLFAEIVSEAGIFVEFG